MDDVRLGGLKEALAGIVSPVWLVEDSGQVIYFNGGCIEGVFPDEKAGQVLWTQFHEEGADLSIEVGLPDARRLHPVGAILHKDQFRTESQPAVHLIMAGAPGGEMDRERELNQALLGQMLHAGQHGSDCLLSPQQKVIFRLLSQKQSYKEIAAHLGVAHSTVRVQIAALRKLLGSEVVPVLRRIRVNLIKPE